MAVFEVTTRIDESIPNSLPLDTSINLRMRIYLLGMNILIIYLRRAVGKFFLYGSLHLLGTPRIPNARLNIEAYTIQQT